jgi:hypothetical protein
VKEQVAECAHRCRWPVGSDGTIIELVPGRFDEIIQIRVHL